MMRPPTAPSRIPFGAFGVLDRAASGREMRAYREDADLWSARTVVEV